MRGDSHPQRLPLRRLGTPNCGAARQQSTQSANVWPEALNEHGGLLMTCREMPVPCAVLHLLASKLHTRRYDWKLRVGRCASKLSRWKEFVRWGRKTASPSCQRQPQLNLNLQHNLKVACHEFEDANGTMKRLAGKELTRPTRLGIR
jgi:hypothetical protein